MNNRKPAPEPVPAPTKTNTQIALEIAREHAKAASLEIAGQQGGPARTKMRLEMLTAATNLASVELAVASARLEHRETTVVKREKALEEPT